MIRRTLVLLAALLTGASAASAQYDFTWEVGDRGAVTEMGVIHTFHTYVVNTGSQTDTYSVDFTADLPPNWFSSLCEGEFCYAPYPIVTHFEFTLDPGDSNQIGVNMTPVAVEGAGEAVITVTSHGNGALQVSNDFAVFSDSLDVLVVDDDPGGDPSPWFGDALAGTGLSSGVWVRDSMGLLEAPTLAGMSAVLWATGDDASIIGTDDQTALYDYVNAGGRLYLSGADFLRGQSSPPSLPRLAWMQNVLGAHYAGAEASATQVDGLAGDALGDGLSFAIAGGDGAANNGAPDLLNIAGTGTAWAEYAGGGTAASRVQFGQGRAVFTGFAFEGVATATERKDLLDAIREWLADSSPSAAGDAPRLLLAVPRARPNPFNPSTSIVFALGGERALAGAVDVYDLRGRRVRELFRGALTPGPQALLWNGRDDAGRRLPSGVYLARVQAGAQSATVKMTLAK